MKTDGRQMITGNWLKSGGHRSLGEWFKSSGGRKGGGGMSAARLPLTTLFLAGVLLGILLLSFGKKGLLEESGVLGEEMLYHMKYMTVDSNAFLWYVLGERLQTVVIAAVLATTYLGLAAVCTMTVWFGMSTGMFVSIVLMRYGIKGILLAVVGIFPQYLVYVPAFYFLMIWCEQVCRGIYFEKNVALEDKKQLLLKLFQLVLITIVVIIGILLESYVNPALLGGLLKIF